MSLIKVFLFDRKDWQSVEGEGGRLLMSENSNRCRDMETETRNIRFFTKVFTVTQIIGILTIVLLVVWLNLFRGGFAWHSNPKLEFNWHPLFMVLGLVFLYANGALVYRAFRGEMKRKLKLIHAGFHLSALIFTIIGLQAVFDSHNLNVDAQNNPKPLPNLYSLHSWLGLSVVILFSCQWAMGLITFLAPGFRSAIRSAYLPLHTFFGIAIFVGAVATSLLGLN
ncbi:UNVERIFIED_CONTAM: hypothetical protein GTU68_022927 [Idotea baltica]|nr:hypothetical protein [Idotea baltica]